MNDSSSDLANQLDGALKAPGGSNEVARRAVSPIAAQNGAPAQNSLQDSIAMFAATDELDGSTTDTPIPGPDCAIFTYIDDKIVPSALPADLTRPYLLVNIGSGVSFFQVFDNRRCERITGSSFGGSALGGLLLLLTRARSFEEMLDLAEKGDNAKVDKLIGDIYGMDYNRIGMKMTAVASTFCKAFSVHHRPDDNGEEPAAPFSNADICHSLVFAVFNNIGQLATLQSRVYDNADIYFTGPYVRDNALIIRTLCIAVRYYSGGVKQAHVVSDPSHLNDAGA